MSTSCIFTCFYFFLVYWHNIWPSCGIYNWEEKIVAIFICLHYDCNGIIWIPFCAQKSQPQNISKINTSTYLYFKPSAQYISAYLVEEHNIALVLSTIYVKKIQNFGRKYNLLKQNKDKTLFYKLKPVVRGLGYKMGSC